jgi:purine-binding chemotaxis protein CheW
MAKQVHRAARPKAEAIASGTGASDDVAARIGVVVFEIAESRFGLVLADVREIARMPRLAHMPLAPRSLLGLANLHGVVVPVVDLRTLLGYPSTESATARVIVVGGDAPVGLTVDRIEQLTDVSLTAMGDDKAGAGSIDPELLEGVVKGAEGESTIKVLNPQRLLRHEFDQLASRAQRPAAGAQGAVSTTVASATDTAPQVSLLSFDLGEQEYALPLDRVREIIQLPEQVAEVAHSETAILGVITLRDRLLPLVSLRALLGLPAATANVRGKVVVVPMGRGAIGVVTDRTREILHADPDTIDPAPALLTRGAGDAEITAICRLERGKRLVALLSPDHLFRSDVVRRVLSEHAGAVDAEDAQDAETMADEQFIVFRLGDQEYGLPIASVDEIARMPERLARIPKAPAFVDGVMNLRGAVVPIIDLRRRFNISSERSAGSNRILVLSLGAGKTGFVVDAVSEVSRIPESAIGAAPAVSAEQMRLIGRIANLDAQDRLIFLVDPANLLDRIEADVLAKFSDTASGQETKAS